MSLSNVSPYSYENRSEYWVHFFYQFIHLSFPTHQPALLHHSKLPMGRYKVLPLRHLKPANHFFFFFKTAALRNVLFALFHVAMLTDLYDWLMLLWLLRETPSQQPWSIFLHRLLAMDGIGTIRSQTRSLPTIPWLLFCCRVTVRAFFQTLAKLLHLPLTCACQTNSLFCAQRNYQLESIMTTNRKLRGQLRHFTAPLNNLSGCIHIFDDVHISLISENSK